MLAAQHIGSWPYDQGNAAVLDRKLEKLERFVDNTVVTMADTLGVSPEEALNILIKVHVKMLGDLKGAVHIFSDHELLQRVTPEKLCKEIEEAIMAISEATALDTDEITEIFAKNEDATMADVSYRLHLRSLIDRSYTS